METRPAPGGNPDGFQIQNAINNAGVGGAACTAGLDFLTIPSTCQRISPVTVLPSVIVNDTPRLA